MLFKAAASAAGRFFVGIITLRLGGIKPPKMNVTNSAPK